MNPTIYVGLVNSENTAKIGEIRNKDVIILVGPTLSTPVSISFDDCEKVFGL